MGILQRHRGRRRFSRFAATAAGLLETVDVLHLPILRTLHHHEKLSLRPSVAWDTSGYKGIGAGVTALTYGKKVIGMWCAHGSDGSLANGKLKAKDVGFG